MVPDEVVETGTAVGGEACGEEAHRSLKEAKIMRISRREGMASCKDK